MPLILNPWTGKISPQFHVVFDNWFISILSVGSRDAFDLSTWQDLFTTSFFDEDDLVTLGPDWLQNLEQDHNQHDAHNLQNNCNNPVITHQREPTMTLSTTNPLPPTAIPSSNLPPSDDPIIAPPSPMLPTQNCHQTNHLNCLQIQLHLPYLCHLILLPHVSLVEFVNHLLIRDMMDPKVLDMKQFVPSLPLLDCQIQPMHFRHSPPLMMSPKHLDIMIP